MWDGAFSLPCAHGLQQEALFPAEGIGIQQSEEREAHAGDAFEERIGGNITVAGGEKQVSGIGGDIPAMIERGAGPVGRRIQKLIMTGYDGHFIEQQGQTGRTMTNTGIHHAVGPGIPPGGCFMQDTDGIGLPVGPVAVHPDLPQGRPHPGIAVAPRQPPGLIGLAIHHPVRKQGAIGRTGKPAGEQVIHALANHRIGIAIACLTAQGQQYRGYAVGQAEVDFRGTGLRMAGLPGEMAGSGADGEPGKGVGYRVSGVGCRVSVKNCLD